ncbi:hypothetical protein [Pannonibacter phragmitetus]|uniref:hypothetical protein n=1 Tax=Pannonibacter phragmitetus TaxID=121719 RepID=UPI003D2ED4A8
MTRVASRSLDEDTCPVSEETFQNLMHLNAASAASAAADLPEEQKARLAVFCYHKAHLRPIGLMIAAGCSLRALLDEAGHAGEILYRQSREMQSSLPCDKFQPQRGARPPVTLYAIKG